MILEMELEFKPICYLYIRPVLERHCGRGWIAGRAQSGEGLDCREGTEWGGGGLQRGYRIVYRVGRWFRW